MLLTFEVRHKYVLQKKRSPESIGFVTISKLKVLALFY